MSALLTEKQYLSYFYFIFFLYRDIQNRTDTRRPDSNPSEPCFFKSFFRVILFMN